MKTLRTLCLAGLLGLNSNVMAEPPKASVSFYGATYLPMSESLEVQGIPFGMGIGLDYGNKKYGIKGDLSYITQVDYSDERVNSRGVVIEGGKAGSNLTRVSLGGRVGSPEINLGMGFVGLEENNFFTQTERGFFTGTRTRDFPNKENYSGVYGEFQVGGKIGEIGKRKRDANVFFRGTFDYLQDGVKGLMLNLGMRF